MAANRPLSIDEQRQIAWSGLTLFERVDIYEQSDNRLCDLIGGETDEMDDFMNKWATVVADGERRTLTKRLMTEDISEQSYQTCLQQKKWPESVDIPAWVSELNDLISYIERTSVDALTESDETR